MGYKETYNRWLTSDVVDDDTKAELKSIENNEKEIEERFYRELEFGTAGMRGIIGAGTNRINIYNVRRASQGVAKYVLSNGEDAAKAGVLIGYDTRNFSRTFAEETAKVLTCAGVKTYLFPIVHSVPEVSFGIRELGCSAGVMITAATTLKNTTVTRYTVPTADNFLRTRLMLLLPQSTATIYLTMLSLFRLTRQKKKDCLKL